MLRIVGKSQKVVGKGKVYRSSDASDAENRPLNFATLAFLAALPSPRKPLWTGFGAVARDLRTFSGAVG